LEASALGSLIAACPAWKRREEKREDIGRKSGFFIPPAFDASVREVPIGTLPQGLVEKN